MQSKRLCYGNAGMGRCAFAAACFAAGSALAAPPLPRRSSQRAFAATPRASLRGPAEPGRTYLVGSGPGGVDHLTHRAARLVSTADVIVADALADPAVVALARPGAEVVHVGKRGGAPGSATQADICALLVALARGAAPRSIVRLKAGDPALFGRAGEEIAALTAAALPFEIVPGVSSVSAAAAAAGMSLTDRDAGRSVVAVSGHDVDALDYATLAACDVVTVLMAGRAFREIVDRLRAADVESEPGLPPRSASVVRWAGRQDEETVVSATIDKIADEVERVLPNGFSPAVAILSRRRGP